jgi:hypothetical protein
MLGHIKGPERVRDLLYAWLVKRLFHSRSVWLDGEQRSDSGSPTDPQGRFTELYRSDAEWQLHHH